MADNEPARWFVQDPWMPPPREPAWWPMFGPPVSQSPDIRPEEVTK